MLLREVPACKLCVARCRQPVPGAHRGRGDAGQGAGLRPGGGAGGGAEGAASRLQRGHDAGRPGRTQGHRH